MQSNRDLILIQGEIFTLDPSCPKAEALAIRNGYIIKVGRSKEILNTFKSPKTRVIDLKGACVIPGLVDSHGHMLALGKSLRILDLRGIDSPEKIAHLVYEASQTIKPGEWIEGRGWDQNQWAKKEFPSKELLDKVAPYNPVYLKRIDGHASWVNSLALDIAKITAHTSDPLGGKIIKDPKTKEPTGILLDKADLKVKRHLPQPDLETIRQDILNASFLLRKMGIVGVHDMDITSDTFEVYKRLAEDKTLKTRVWAYMGAQDLANFKTEKASKKWGLFSLMGVKLYADGALGSRGAALFEPYSDDPKTRGILVEEPNELRSKTLEFMNVGYQVAIHAIGDRANRMVLDVFEEVLDLLPDREYRPRVEHVQIIHPVDVLRFSRGNIIASIQPVHLCSDIDWVKSRLGESRLERAYIWKGIINAGGRIAVGSDFPIDDPDPRKGIYAAITRGSPQKKQGLNIKERINLKEVLHAYTKGAAYAVFAEKDLGMISPGFKADLTIFDQNIFKIDPEEILNLKVVFTIVQGEIVYSNSEI